VTKSDIAEAIHERVGFTQKRSAEVVEMILELMKESLERGEKIKISGFGNFEVREKKPRKGRNPQTGEEIIISERRVITFRPSELLKEQLKGSG
jgi:integration host factor subunit alpha